MTELQVIARYRIAPGHEDEVAALVTELAAASRAEPGCLAFDAFVQLDDARSVVLLERYESATAFAAHRDTAHFAALVPGRLIPLLESRTVETYDLPG